MAKPWVKKSKYEAWFGGVFALHFDALAKKCAKTVTNYWYLIMALRKDIEYFLEITSAKTIAKAARFFD